MKIYGLVGERLGHSFSKKFFTELFAKQGLESEYRNFEIEDIAKIKDVFEIENVVGLNVTIPYKTAVIPFLDELSEEAQKIGAVNTIVRKNNRWIGHNTDAFGFAQSVKPFLTFHHEKALIIGTGGASKAVVYVLENLGIDVLFISRNPKGEKQFGYDEINGNMLRACKLIVNTTPLGMFPKVEKCPTLPFEELTAEHLVVDLIYNPAKTLFLEKSEQNGATILNGQAMLEQQALRAWEIWMNRG